MKKLFLFFFGIILSAMFIAGCNDSSNFTKIGNQVWTTQNLNVDHFRNGDLIPEAKSDSAWMNAGKNHKPVWCYYNNDSANGVKYGKLYNWFAVNDPRGLAPQGWHLPTCKEWRELLSVFDFQGIAFIDSIGWEFHCGTNESGFCGLPGHSRYAQTFIKTNEHALWWSSSDTLVKKYPIDRFTNDLGDPYFTNEASSFELRSTNNWGCVSIQSSHPFESGLSVRCVKD
jgi:uncharacterized protein (TIGR02145 family)